MVSSASGVFVVDASKLDLSEQESAAISEAISKTVILEIAKLDRTVKRRVDIKDATDPLMATRGMGGIAGLVF